MITILLMWLAIGFICAVAAIIHDFHLNGVIKVQDVAALFLFTFLGPITAIFILTYFLTEKGQVVLYKRNKK